MTNGPHPPQGPWPDAQPPEPPNPSAPRGSWLSRRLDSPEAAFFWRRNHYTIIYMLIAFLLAMSIIIVGFRYTLLIVVLLGIAYLLGGWRDRKPQIIELIRRFL